MGEGPERCWAETEYEHTQEKDDVSHRQKEDCSSTTGAVGEVPGAEESSLISKLRVGATTI